MKKLLIFSIALVSFVGCSKVVTSATPNISKLNIQEKSCAILPFYNTTNSHGAGEVMLNNFETQLIKQNICKVVEQSQIDVKLKSIGIDKERLFDTDYAISIGTKLGVDYLFIGKVTEFGYQYGLREDPAVGLSSRMIDVCNAKVIWAGDEGRVNRSFIFRDSLSGSAIELTKSLVSTIK
jgi:TolB-like protein